VQGPKLQLALSGKKKKKAMRNLGQTHVLKEAPKLRMAAAGERLR